MRRAGEDELSTVGMFSTIQKLKRTGRMSFWDTELSFGGEDWRDLEALMGVRQGGGLRPEIWVVISSVFFDALRDNGFGAILTAPFSINGLHIAGFGFVDDTDILQTGSNRDDYWGIAEKLQAVVDL